VGVSFWKPASQMTAAITPQSWISSKVKAEKGNFKRETYFVAPKHKLRTKLPSFLNDSQVCGFPKWKPHGLAQPKTPDNYAFSASLI